MDSIWNCAFGLDIDLQNNRENDYFVNSENVFKKSLDMNFFQKLSCK
jgi:hypothetical protein